MTRIHSTSFFGEHHVRITVDGEIVYDGTVEEAVEMQEHDIESV